MKDIEVNERVWLVGHFKDNIKSIINIIKIIYPDAQWSLHVSEYKPLVTFS